MHIYCARVSFYIFNMELVENDFNIVKSKTFLTVTENNVDEVYDSSLSLLAEEFNYLEIIDYDKT